MDVQVVDQEWWLECETVAFLALLTNNCIIFQLEFIGGFHNSNTYGKYCGLSYDGLLE